jgi:flagellar basal-body rod modification protein FlgD
MDINAILGAGMNAAAATEARRGDDLGRDEFLRMLITQLENQDPLNPQDATEFTAQLAQFSSLDQLFSMRAAIGDLAAAQGDSNALSVASLIGKRVLVESSRFEVPVGGDAPQLLLESGAPSAILGVELRDGSGRVVAQLGARTLPAGRSALAWEDFGGVPPPGAYRISVTPAGGSAQPALLVDARVSGAAFDSGRATLLLGAEPVSLSALRAVRE